MKKSIAVLLAVTLLLGFIAGCKNSADSSQVSSQQTEPAPSDTSSAVSISDAVSAASDEDMFSNRDTIPDYDENHHVLIQLQGTSAVADSDGVKISGSTITITEEADYVITGSLDNGMIIVNTDASAKPHLVLRDAHISSDTSAAIYILNADKVFITLDNDTENSLSSGESYVPIDDSNIDAAVFSKQDLTISGSGHLTVTSPTGHGIVCKDDLVITGGTYTVASASHGFNANDSIRITGETNLIVDSGKDGLHCENTEDLSLGFIYISGGYFDIASEGDGISAGAYLQIEDGYFDIEAGGGSINGNKEASVGYGGFMGGHHGRDGIPSMENSYITDESSTSMKGLKAADSIGISCGVFNINSADDSVHSDASVFIYGGTFDIFSGDDAFHAENTLKITSGTINITECFEGLEALDVEVCGGDICLSAKDDGLNAAGGVDSSGITGGRDGMFPGHGGMSASSNGSIDISGGNLYINASGDGLDANGSITISGGYTVVVGPARGDTSTLDYDTTAVITGGTFIGTGAAGMAQTFSNSEQGVIALSMDTQSAGTAVSLCDKNGNSIISHTPELSFAIVILSCPDMVPGELYTVAVGANSADFEAY